MPEPSRNFRITVARASANVCVQDSEPLVSQEPTIRTRASPCSRSQVAARFRTILPAALGSRLFGSNRMGRRRKGGSGIDAEVECARATDVAEWSTSEACFRRPRRGPKASTVRPLLFSNSTWNTRAVTELAPQRLGFGDISTAMKTQAANIRMCECTSTQTALTQLCFELTQIRHLIIIFAYYNVWRQL
jgi:hypothetical protein